MHAAVLAHYQEPFTGPCSFTTVTSETDVVVAAGVRGSVLLREAESAEFSVVKGRWTRGLPMDSREQVEGRRQAGAGGAPWPVSQRAGSPEHVATVGHARPRCLVEVGVLLPGAPTPVQGDPGYLLSPRHPFTAP